MGKNSEKNYKHTQRFGKAKSLTLCPDAEFLVVVHCHVVQVPFARNVYIYIYISGVCFVCILVRYEFRLLAFIRTGDICVDSPFGLGPMLSPGFRFVWFWVVVLDPA